jgi:hypothetical protein
MSRHKRQSNFEDSARVILIKLESLGLRFKMEPTTNGVPEEEKITSNHKV